MRVTPKLTETKIRAARPKETLYKLADGKDLHLAILSVARARCGGSGVIAGAALRP